MFLLFWEGETTLYFKNISIYLMSFSYNKPPEKYDLKPLIILLYTNSSQNQENWVELCCAPPLMVWFPVKT